MNLEPIDPDKLLYSRNEAARMLSVTLRTVERAIKRGDLKVKRINTRVLIPRAELAAFASL